MQVPLFEIWDVEFIRFNEEYRALSVLQNITF